MGKVYEARQRSEGESRKAKLSTIALPGNITLPAIDAREKAEHFDFVDYSLNALPAEEIAQHNQEVAASAFVRRSLLQPEQEVTLDMSRIESHLATFFDVNHVASEQFSKLAISLVSEKEERPLKRLLITSTQRAEGRTGVALNLACALAQAKQRVLIVDADLQRPSLLRFLGIDVENGLTTLIKKNLTPGQSLVKVLPFGFHILPTRERVNNPAEILTSAKFREVLTALEPEYDFILFDAPPLLQANNTNLLIRLANATVLVIQAGKTSSLQLSKAVSSLTHDHLFGVVLNRTVN